MKKQAVNPYLPSYEYVPDGEPRLFGDRLYIFGSHDRFNGTAFCMNDYVCWSAPAEDLGDWRYEGVIYRKTQDPNNPEGTRSMYAPDVIRGPQPPFPGYRVCCRAGTGYGDHKNRTGPAGDSQCGRGCRHRV